MDGLSPRVRGNQRHGWLPALALRSIPAGAGEPRVICWLVCSRAVYPRGCGGTRRWGEHRRHPGGLSPRVRGNQQLRDDLNGGQRSIPAGAGEPSSAWIPFPLARVYPRGCGGISILTEERMKLRGLSPRARGNHGHDRRGRPTSRSIPAGAGESHYQEAGLTTTWVYPRGCGGIFLLRLQWVR